MNEPAERLGTDGPTAVSAVLNEGGVGDGHDAGVFQVDRSAEVAQGRLFGACGVLREVAVGDRDVARQHSCHHR